MGPSRCFISETGTDMLQRMPRPKWTPQTEEQQRAITAVLRAAKRAEQAEGKMWAAVSDAIDQGVPAAFMAETVGRSRATLYRHVARPGKPEAEPED
jgi:hypothetical protein